MEQNEEWKKLEGSFGSVFGPLVCLYSAGSLHCLIMVNSNL